MKTIVEIFNDLENIEYLKIHSGVDRLGDYILQIQKEAYNQAIRNSISTLWTMPLKEVDKQKLLKLKR